MLYMHTHTHIIESFAPLVGVAYITGGTIIYHSINWTLATGMLREGRGGREGKAHKCSRDERVESLHVTD